MILITAPEYRDSYETPSIFLAGTITGAWDWQKEVCRLLDDTKYTVFNPRRDNFDVTKPEETLKQIRWEYDHLRKATEILFWFSHETLSPIVLYELGTWSMTDKKLHLGVDPKYARKTDVEIQTGLVRPDVYIHNSLENLIQSIIEGGL